MMFKTPEFFKYRAEHLERAIYAVQRQYVETNDYELLIRQMYMKVKNGPDSTDDTGTETTPD